jgi:4-amino-4-deoxy-L-arabinose transferase-like glycosyltransferase
MSDGGMIIEKAVERLSALRGVIVFFVAYGLVSALITRAAGPALALDDVKLNVLTQSLQGGYLPENPPLFEWLLISVQSLTGPTIWSFVIVKYFLLTIAGAFTFLTARIFLNDARWAGLTAVSLLLTYQIGWNYHQAFTHSTALIAAIAFFWWALARLVRTPGFGAYLMLGVAIGLGMLTKYSFAAAALAAIVAALSLQIGRRALVSAAAAPALAIAAAMLAPHLIWLIADNSQVAAEAGARLADASEPHWRRAAEGLPNAVWALVAFFLPLTPILLFNFPGVLRSSGRADGLEALPRLATFYGAAFLIGAVVILGIDNMQERYAVAFMYPGIFWMIGAAKRVATPEAIRRFATIWFATIVAMMGLRIAETVVAGPPFCKECRQWVPYDVLGGVIASLEMDGATLVGFEDHTAGNLRRMFPETRVLSAHMPFYTPDGWADGDKCYFIWSDQLGPPAPEHVTSAVDPTRVWTVEAQWRKALNEDGRRVTRWTIAEFSHKPGIARSLCRPVEGNATD